MPKTSAIVVAFLAISGFAVAACSGTTTGTGTSGGTSGTSGGTSGTSGGTSGTSGPPPGPGGAKSGVFGSVGSSSGASCSPTTGDDACTQCIRSACCTELEACTGSASCIAFAHCAEGCASTSTPDACYARCYNTYSGAQSAVSSLSSCATSYCPSCN